MLPQYVELGETTAPIQPSVQAVKPSLRAQPTPTPLWEWLTLGAIILLATFLDFFNLAPDGFPNTYYATAVKSMLLSWHNFYFVSFDPGGFVTIDKPPVAFWLQTICAKLFGFNGVSLVLPQALAGVLAVALLYHLVRRTFGGPAALIAALVLALAPISVVANRDNIVDSLLVLTSLCAAWAMLKATEKNHLGWLLLSGVLIGVGFNIKMLEAYLIVPALVLLFLLGASLPWWKRGAFLVLMLGVMFVVSLSWALSVDLTPANDRPYVGSSQTNSEIELAFGYNGIQRLLDTHAPKPKDTSTPTKKTVTTRPVLVVLAALVPMHVQGTALVAASPPVKTVSTANDPGPLRLFQPYLGSQIGWLLPLALFGLCASIWNLQLRSIFRRWSGQHGDAYQQGFILWGVWCITQCIVFSFAHAFSAYYMVMLMPAIAALTGIGLVGLVRDYRAQRGWRQWILPIALLVTGVEQYLILKPVKYWVLWLDATILILALAGGIVLFGIQLVRHIARRRAHADAADTAEMATTDAPRAAPVAVRFTQRALLPAALFVVMLVPTLWTFASLNNTDVSSHPISGPHQAGVAVTPHADPKLVAYLTSHAADAPFLVATVTADMATPIIFSTDAPVMAMGGFSGSNPILSVDDLANLVTNGTVRNFLLPASNLSPSQVKQLYPDLKTLPKTQYTNSLTRWVGTNCTPVPMREWSTSYSTHKVGAFALFNCANVALPPV